MASTVTRIKAWLDWRREDADGTKCMVCGDVAWNGFQRLWVLTSAAGKFNDIRTEKCVCDSCKEVFDSEQE